MMAVILIVEDEVFIREMAEMMIQDSSHHTLSASDVDEALSFLRSAQHIDALFTDIYLKTLVLGGCDLARQAIKLRPKLRVLYTTGNYVNDKMKALFVEGTQCLPKPCTQYQLQGRFAAGGPCLNCHARAADRSCMRLAAAPLDAASVEIRKRRYSRKY